MSRQTIIQRKVVHFWFTAGKHVIYKFKLHRYPICFLLCHTKFHLITHRSLLYPVLLIVMNLVCCVPWNSESRNIKVCPSHYCMLWMPQIFLTCGELYKGNNKITEQSYKGKGKTHKYINRQNQSTTGKL
jgi:hypothetical protein